MPEPPVVQVEDLNFTYNGESALQAINLTVQRGDFLVLLGPNGGGKTTLLKCILGLLIPQSGSVTVFGGTPQAAGKRMGYVPQQSELKHHFPITAAEVVRLGVPKSRKGRNNLIMDALQRVEMQDLAGARFDTLSGGQRQRVLVARALAGEPELLVLDEPTANIDPQGKVCIYELLATLSREATVIVVSHDLVFSAAGISAVAAVNKRLVSTRGHSLTPDMLSLIYGVHHHSCPMEDLLQEVSHIFTSRAGGEAHDHGGEDV